MAADKDDIQELSSLIGAHRILNDFLKLYPDIDLTKAEKDTAVGYIYGKIRDKIKEIKA